MISANSPLNILSRQRFAFGGALALIALSHLSLILLSGSVAPDDVVSVATSCGAVIATCLSLVLTRGIARYPGVESSSYVLPSFLFGYGMLLMVLLLSRLGYSRALLLADFVLTVTWCFAITAITRRRLLTVGVVPEGNYQKLLAVAQINSILLDDRMLNDGAIDAVAADLQHDVSPHWDRYLADSALRGVPVYHAKHLIESITGKVELQHLSENNFGMLSPMSLVMTIKHIVDWLTALTALIALSPIFLALCIAIRLDTPGSSIFRQQRIGYRGRPFTVYKFRTMATVCEAGTSELEAAKTQAADQRITRIGAILRRTRIDELPQVLNILRGEMSWIGPRPEARVLSEWYEAQLPFYRYRHIVRPGITGWAQVHQGHVSEISEVRDKLYYDFYYIKHYSLWIDILIIVRTALTVLTGFGSK